MPRSSKKPKVPRSEFTRQTTERTLANFRDAGIAAYQIRTCGDGRVCDVCKKQNGKNYKTADAVIGKNAPPFCDECRCVILPLSDDVKMPWDKRKNSPRPKTAEGNKINITEDITMGTKNTVTAGDYKGGQLEWKVRITKANEVILHKPGAFAGKFTLDATTVASYEVIDSESKTSAASAIARGGLGAALLGPVGIAAALSAKKKGLYTIALQFTDGKSSLIEVDKDIYKTLVENLFNTIPTATEAQTAAQPEQPTPAANQPLDPAAEIAKYKTLLDSGAITQDEYEAKKKQLLGL